MVLALQIVLAACFVGIAVDMFIDINKNTAAQIAYTASVGRDNTANPKNSEQSAVRTKDVFPSVSILEEIKKYAPAFRYIKPHDMAIS